MKIIQARCLFHKIQLREKGKKGQRAKGQKSKGECSPRLTTHNTKTENVEYARVLVEATGGTAIPRNIEP